MTHVFKQFPIWGIALLGLLVQVPVFAQESQKEEGPQFAAQLLQDPGIPASNAAAPSNAASPGSQTRPLSFTPLTGGEKWRHYFRSTYGPVSIGRSAVWAGFDQWIDANPEWGQGMEGYAKRFGSRYGQFVIKRSISQGLGSLLHEDPRYFRSESSGLWPRTWHALEWTFITRKDDGSYKFADARMIGTFTAALISRSWHPESERNIRSGLERGAISLAIDAGWNVFKEFWPDIRSRLRH